MKKMVYAVSIIAALLVGLMSCQPKSGSKVQDNTEAIDAAHNSRNSLDWNGNYAGVIPCADCEGISVQIILNPDETYQVSYLYLGKNDNVPAVSSGKFTWDESGSTIKLDSKDLPPYYKVGENRLIQLDMEGNLITGELADKYILEKSVEDNLPK